MIFLFPFTKKQIHTHYNYKHVLLLSRYDDQPFLFLYIFERYNDRSSQKHVLRKAHHMHLIKVIRIFSSINLQLYVTPMSITKTDTKSHFMVNLAHERTVGNVDR